MFQMSVLINSQNINHDDEDDDDDCKVELMNLHVGSECVCPGSIRQNISKPSMQ